MDLNSAMTIEEWEQIPVLTGMEDAAKEFHVKWKGLVIEQKNEKMRKIIDKALKV